MAKTAWSMLVALGFAVLFNTPRRALWAVALLGVVGFGIRTLLLSYFMPEQIVLATLAGASTVGILGVYFAHRVHTPPIVFTIPAVINMIPGKLGYEFIIGLLKIVNSAHGEEISFAYYLEVLNGGLRTAFILMALALGVIFPILFFNTRTVKDSDLNKLIAEKIIRKKVRRRS